MSFEPEDSLEKSEPPVSSRRKVSFRSKETALKAGKELAEAQLTARTAELIGVAANNITSSFTALTDEKKREELIRIGNEAASDLQKKQSVTRFWEWQKKSAESSSLPTSYFTRLVAESCGMIKLGEELGESPWDLFTFYKSVQIEEEMLEMAGSKVTGGWGLSEKEVAEAIKRKKGMSEEQKAAVEACCSGEETVVIIEGTAGAGKSFSMEAVKEVYEAAGYDVCGAAPSWTAAKVLAESAKIKGGAKAIDKILAEAAKAERNGEEYFKKKTLLICDESGMVGAKKMRDLFALAAQAKHKVRIILTGDSQQLGPVEPGNALEALVLKYGSTRISEIRRQNKQSHRAAVKKFSEGNAAEGLWTFWQQERVKLIKTDSERLDAMVKDYSKFALSYPEKTALALALKNTDVAILNGAIRGELKKAGRITGPEYKVRVTDGRSIWDEKFAVGDQVVFRKNVIHQPVLKSKFKTLSEAYSSKERENSETNQGGFFKNILKMLSSSKEPDSKEVLSTGVFNRTSGVILSINENSAKKGTFDITVLLPGGGETKINTSDFIDDEERDDGKPPSKAVMIHHNFATTIYASQGQTVDRVFIADSPLMNRRLAYVGMSRHREDVDVYISIEDVTNRMSRDKGRRADKAWRSYAKNESRANRINRDEDKDKDVLLSSRTRGLKKQKWELVRELRDELNQIEMEKKERDSDLLEEVARQWSCEAPNLTAYAAKYHITHGNFEKPKNISHYPRRAPEDDPDDMHDKNNQKAMDMFNEKKDKSLQILTELAPEISQDTLKEMMGKIWLPGKGGNPRIIACDVDGEIVSRYSPEGFLVAGDGEVPILPNWQARAMGIHSSYMLVQNLQDALKLHQHFYEKFADNIEKIPHIVIALPGVDLAYIKRWSAGFDSDPQIAVACPPSRPTSEVWGVNMISKLEKNNMSATIWPQKKKKPQP